MGYESRIYIVRKCQRVDPDFNKRFAEILMVFNLGKVSYGLEDWLRNHEPTDCFIYADDGDTAILEDCYGEPLKEIDFAILKYKLLCELDEYKNCRLDAMDILANRVLTPLFNRYGNDQDRIVCLHYGY